MSSAARNYHYPLEPLQRKHQWQLEAAQARLGQCEAAHVAALTHLGALQAEHAASAAAARARTLIRLDPDAQRATLTYLLQVGTRIRMQEHAIDEIEQRRRQLRTDCLSEHGKLEAFERDHERCLAEWSHAWQIREGHEQDRDWNARGAWHAGKISVSEVSDISEISDMRALAS